MHLHIPKKPKRKKLFLHGGKTSGIGEPELKKQLSHIVKKYHITQIIVIQFPGEEDKNKRTLFKERFEDILIVGEHQLPTDKIDWKTTLIYLPGGRGSNLDLYHSILSNPSLMEGVFRSRHLFGSSAGMMILGSQFRIQEDETRHHPGFDFYPYIGEPHLHERNRMQRLQRYQKKYPSQHIIGIDEQTTLTIDRTGIGETRGLRTATIYPPSKIQEKKRRVYILRCSDTSLYTGITTDLCRRLIEHNCLPNGAKYTRNKRPVTLVWSQSNPNRSEASKVEYQVKKLSKAKKELLISTGSSFTLC